MKRILVFGLVGVGFLGIVSGCLALREAVHEETVFLEGIGRGYRGPIRVMVETLQDTASSGGFSGHVILNVEILEHEEDEFVGAEAIRELLDLVIETGSADSIDAVSGATESSRGFLEAVENALQSRGY